MFLGSSTVDSPGGASTKSGWICAVTESYVQILMRAGDEELMLVAMEEENWTALSNSEPEKSSPVVFCSALRFSVKSIRGGASN